MNTPSKSKKNEKVWVEVEVNKFTDGITVFRGQMLKSDIDAWANGELIDCAIKLENTYWFMQDSICYLGKGEGVAKQYSGTTYIKVETVMLIFILSDESYPCSQMKKISSNIFSFPGRQ